MLNALPATEFDMVSNIPCTEGVPAGSDPASATRHESLWFDDGSVVLSVEQTLFRVHRSILCAQSEIFADMFRIAQPDDETTIEGCAVVCLPDKAAEFVDLLKACYKPLYFDGIRPDADIGTTLIFVSGILRLSTKYCIDPLRQKCIEILKRKIPTSSLTEMDATFGLHVDGVGYAEFSADICFSIINLARETNIPELLPFAFYLCARLPTNVVLNGTPTAASVLSWNDKAICLAGRIELSEAQRALSEKTVDRWISTTSCCKRGVFCYGAISAEWRRLIDLVGIVVLEIFPPATVTQACAHSVEHARSQLQEGRKQVWDMLPKVFQLGSWEDVRNSKN